MNKTDILKTLDLPDAFAGFTADPNSRLWGWAGDTPVFEALIKEVKPNIILEVGSWLGQSTSTMAKALQNNGLKESTVIAIDTWLGSQEHWESPEHRPHLELEFGYPTLYRRFLSNMLNVSCAKHVVPLPLPSLIAARFLAKHSIRAELIYIDGSHDEKDVYDDVTAYWDLLAPGGTIFGDDYYVFPSVGDAVRRFCSEHGLGHDTNGLNWRIKKGF